MSLKIYFLTRSKQTFIRPHHRMYICWLLEDFDWGGTSDSNILTSETEQEDDTISECRKYETAKT